jgi:Laminin G domain
MPTGGHDGIEERERGMSRTVRALASAVGVASVALATALVGTVATPAPADATSNLTVVGRWMLDESYGVPVAHDATGHHFDGSIGSMVRPGVAGYYATAFRFTPPSGEVKDPERIVVVPDAPSLNPGWKVMRISLRVRTSYSGEFNIVQKGQAATPGGFWKVQMDDGYPSCVFKGVKSDGTTSTIGLKYGKPLNDGAWHRIVCEKHTTYVNLRVDGGTPLVTYKRAGHIANTWNLVMGGKVSCNPSYSWVGCDYYHGDLDSVVLSMSS